MQGQTLALLKELKNKSAVLSLQSSERAGKVGSPGLWQRITTVGMTTR